MLNIKDVNQLKAVLVTKQDLKKMQADNLKIFATKKDLSDSQNRMLTLLASKEEVKELRSDITDLKELVQGLIVASDGIVKSIKDLSLEYAAISTERLGSATKPPGSFSLYYLTQQT